jgi:hypothetical protein
MYRQRQRNQRNLRRAQKPRPRNNQGIIMIKRIGTPSGFLPSLQTFPAVLHTKMRWAWNGNVTTTAGAASVQTVRLTSLFDPDFTGTGNQPRYFDTLCAASGGTAPYTFFRVKKAHFCVTFMNNSSTSGTAGLGYVNIYMANALSTTSSLDAYFDAPNTTTVFYSANGQENAYQTVTGSVDIAKFVGNLQAYDDEDLEGSYAANPSTNVFLGAGVRSMDDTTVVGIRVLIQVIYEVEFFSLNDAGAS